MGYTTFGNRPPEAPANVEESKEGTGPAAHGEKPSYSCSHCGLELPSRNALFKHLAAKCDPTAAKLVETREKVVFAVGYLGSKYCGSLRNHEDDEAERPTVEGALLKSLRSAWGDDEVLQGLLRSTRTEKGSHAVENVFVVTLKKRAGNVAPRDLDKLRGELESRELWLLAPALPVPSPVFDKVYDGKKRVYRVYVPYHAILPNGKPDGLAVPDCKNDIWMGPIPNGISGLEIAKVLSERCRCEVEASAVAVSFTGGSATITLKEGQLEAVRQHMAGFRWPDNDEVAILPAAEAHAKIALQRQARSVLKRLRGPPKGHRDFHNFILEAQAGSPLAMRNLQHLGAGYVGHEPRRPSAEGLPWYETDWTYLQFSAREFASQQLRRMVGVVVAVMRGIEEPEYIDRCFGKEKLTLLPAPAEAVCLDSVQFGQWNTDWRSMLAFEASSTEALRERIEERVVVEADRPWREFISRLDGGATKVELRHELASASAAGDVSRIEAALGACNEGLNLTDEYGQTALFLAAHSGQAAAVRSLLERKAEVDKRANGGSTPCIAAAANGHWQVVDLLRQGGADMAAPGSEGRSAEDFMRRRGAEPGKGLTVGSSPSAPSRVGKATVVVPVDSDHPGSGSVYVDGALDDEFLDMLQELWQKLPLAIKDKASPTERAYFADTEGWITKNLNAAIAQAGFDFKAAAMPLMRFLIYPEPGGYLPAHVDLQRADPKTGRRSTHTFLLYLSDCTAGGETSLLSTRPGDVTLRASGGCAPGPRDVVVSVEPRRGRLFMFPHICPHLAAPVDEVPKVLLRGEVIPCD
eukprot:TRINITY_DN7374_c0_g2_i2.p1 TRINITY_DN7374_c0_g2~~TRINITY_DN7374_c0_g2_i2.p1  ORF type:complete len:808 (+),score=159.28 TRINITY_DN7374_c0_g2_i2:73-2496(+)